MYEVVESIVQLCSLPAAEVAEEKTLHTGMGSVQTCYQSNLAQQNEVFWLRARLLNHGSLGG